MTAYSADRSLIWLTFELFIAFMVVLVTYKNKEDPIKNENARMLISLYVDFHMLNG